MAFVIYTQIKELKVQEKEIYEFGNWLRGVDSSIWDEELENYDSDESSNTLLNADGNIMEYPWDDFSYVIIPDNDIDIDPALTVGESLGVIYRFDIFDLDRVFFVVK
jgi:hypothetical protein